ncbi:histidine kinase dimerization/phospho-acceptor domain-containing protein [Paenibacillus melissococcoides]
MKIINRIMISSAFLVLLSLISLLSVIGVTIWLFTLNGDGGKELLDKDIFHAEEILGGFDVSTRDWEMLNDKLSIYGYNLLVLKDDNIVFTALSDLQNEVIDGLKNLEPEQGALAGKSVDFTFVTMIAGDFSMYAIKSSADHSGGVLGFLQQLLLLFLVLILVILLLSQLFTRKLAWRILNPLSALSEGAKRIERGDLSKPLTYTGNDEFASVCAAFNHMQEHLIKEREKNTAYEKARVDLVAGISHDLRTPLTSIKGYIKGLRDGVANTPEKRENYLRIAYQKSCEMDVLLQKLFYYSNLETGNLPLSLADVDLGCFVRDFVAA